MNELCHDYRKAKKELGGLVAEKLFALLNLLESAENLYDVDRMRIYHLHALQGERQGQYALDLGRKSGYRLIVIPMNPGETNEPESDQMLMYKACEIILVWEVSKHYE